MVPVKSSIELFKNIPNNKKQLLLINDYYHDVFKGEKVDKICCQIEYFLKQKNYKIKNEKIEI